MLTLFLSSVILSLFRFFLGGVSQNRGIMKRAPITHHIVAGHCFIVSIISCMVSIV